MDYSVKVIVAGGRDFDDYSKALPVLDELLFYKGDCKYFDGVTIVSGGARGADALGEQFAREFMLPVMPFPADWNAHGKAAGPIRNVQMAEYADILVAFWDGESRGTKHMIDTALAHGLEVHVYPYEVSDTGKVV